MLSRAERSSACRGEHDVGQPVGVRRLWRSRAAGVDTDHDGVDVVNGTHEPCGRGHEKPIGRPCGICLAMDEGIVNLGQAESGGDSREGQTDGGAR